MKEGGGHRLLYISIEFLSQTKISKRKFKRNESGRRTTIIICIDRIFESSRSIDRVFESSKNIDRVFESSKNIDQCENLNGRTSIIIYIFISIEFSSRAKISIEFSSQAEISMRKFEWNVSGRRSRRR